MSVRSSRRPHSLFPANLIANSRRALLVAAAVVAFPATGVMADITGFNGLAGWRYNQAADDLGTPASTPNPNTVQLTTGGGQLRSIFNSTPQSITQFTASFTYRANGGGVGRRLAFILQNAPNGDGAIGTNGHAYRGITNSVAVLFDIDQFGGQYVGYFTGGVIPSLGEFMSVNAGGRDVRVTINYAGGNALSLNLTDVLDPTRTFSRNYILPASIATSVGSGTAFVGFGASTFGGVDHIVSNFSYVIPSPSAAALLGLGGLMAARRRR
jgi:hypothetical protein